MKPNGSIQEAIALKDSEAPAKPAMWKVHLALLSAQIMFGAGSVVGKLGTHRANPVLFALVRDGMAGPILCLLAYAKDRALPQMKHLWWFTVTGAFIFLSQVCFIVGLKLSNAVIGSAWQPSQSIMVTAIAIAIGRERATFFKISGILLAFGGALFIVLYGADFEAGSSELSGNILYFINCLGTALYIICSKPMFSVYPSMSITAWSYISAAIMIVITALVVNTVPEMYNFLCDDCPAGSQWHVPPNAWYALIYWILFTSVACYILLTWANQHADASMVLAYTPVQPATSALLSFVIIQTGLSSELQEPGYNALGIIGIFLGLALVIHDSRRAQQPQGLPYKNVSSFDTFQTGEHDRESKGEQYAVAKHISG
uniref:EamA domain-containing protein n=1 Tax=Lotharella oceanica TaxID=641309 RepID=A0A7S2XFP5_9EUKA|mmetsp:Transcript_37080/g.68460  ORF Transcript_37080/g.68460 Transcript_37080/m.68460 type:complete len:372 (+) Transcript_37080:65-1180(+)